MSKARQAGKDINMSRKALVCHEVKGLMFFQMSQEITPVKSRRGLKC